MIDFIKHWFTVLAFLLGMAAIAAFVALLILVVVAGIFFIAEGYWWGYLWFAFSVVTFIAIFTYEKVGLIDRVP